MNGLSSSLILGRSTPLASRFVSRILFVQRANFTEFFGSQTRKKLPVNTVINLVPQQEAWIVERFGKFYTVLQPGLALLFPVIDRISYVHTLKEIALEIPSQSAITQDNVTLSLDGVLYLRIYDPYKASYGVEDPEFAVSQLAQTTMRSEIGKLSMDTVFRERTHLNASIVEAINQAASSWGISCLRYEIRDISIPERVVESMQMQVAAERRKRAVILESEGKKDAAINIATGEKVARVLASEAERQEQINVADGESAGMIARAKATAIGIREVADALASNGGDRAAAMKIAEQYIGAFSNVAKEGTTLLLPTNANDPAAFVAQAMSVFGKVNKSISLSNSCNFGEKSLFQSDFNSQSVKNGLSSNEKSD